MTKRKPLSILIASLFLATPAVAQNVNWQDPLTPLLPVGWITQGEITIAPIYTDMDSKDPSKAIEYRDLDNGALSNILLRGRSTAGQWYDFFGENFGREDMYIDLRGGQYDAWKSRLYWDWIPHERGINMRTPLLDAPSADLRNRFPQPNPDTWAQFNYGYQRKDLGGFFEWQRNSPWYFRVDANQVNTDGLKVGAAANGSSPGNGYIDLPIPVDYKTTNGTFEAGYATSKYQFSFAYTYSKFESGYETMTWSNPYLTTVSTRRTSRRTTTTSASRSTARSGSCRGTRRCRAASRGTSSRAKPTSPRARSTRAACSAPPIPWRARSTARSRIRPRRSR
jgi:hypothetical protein